METIWFLFSTPAGVNDYVLRIVNNAPGGCGNDLALDDITFRSCGPKLTPTIIGYTKDSIDLCQGDTENFIIDCTVSAGFNMPEFKWQESYNQQPWQDVPGNNTLQMPVQIFANSPIGSYRYRLIAAEAGNIDAASCRIYSTPIEIIVHANPIALIHNYGLYVKARLYHFQHPVAQVMNGQAPMDLRRREILLLFLHPCPAIIW